MAAPSTVQSSPRPFGPAAKRMKMDSPPAGIFPCLVCKEPFRRRNDLWEHLTTKENGINVFVCLDCGRGFCKERLLRTHWCEAVEEEEMANKQNTALSVLCHVMACEECGLFAGLINIENPSWKSYSSLCAHPSRSFRKITLYTWTPDAIRFIRSDLSIPFVLRIDFGPAVVSGVPIQCELCEKRYTSVEDVEKHVSATHPVPYAPVQCQQCSCKFSSPLRMDLHISEKHGRGRWDLLDFLKNVAVDEPFMEKAAIVGRTDTYYACDLCDHDFLGSEFNKHDCATNYMRRYLLDGKVIFCPAVNLSECKIDMSIQDPMLVSLSEKVQRNIELCLRFFVPVVAPKMNDFKSDQVYSCNHCERIIISPVLFREHVLEAFQEQRIDFVWPKKTNARDLLSHFGVPVTISTAGFVCPKPGCSTIRCSTVGLELHIRNVHYGTFEALIVPDFVVEDGNDADINPSVPSSCPMCQEQGFRGQEDFRAHVRDCHIHPCNSCASCYTTVMRLDQHKRTSPCGEQPDCTAPLSYCPICKEVFKVLSDYYSHLIAQHHNNVNYDHVIGHILPKCCLFLQPGKAASSDNNHVKLPAATASPVTEPNVIELDVSTDSVVITPEAKPAASPIENDIQVVDPSSEGGHNSSAPEIVTNSGNEEDDELMVCEPDSDSGPGSAGRQPTHHCDHCSKMFFTQRAAAEHRKTHEFDAGVVTDEVLPVPANTPVYVCRLCCLAFEMYDCYAEHMRKHRRSVDCTICSALCLNPQYLASHLESHQKNALAFGCPHCLKAFRSEVALMLHMNQQHEFPVLWHCQMCGLANSEWKQMSSHRCKEAEPNLPVISPTPKKKLHFQPRLGHVSQVRSASTSKASDVAECCHRSFLACKEAGIACPQCGTIIASQTFLAMESNKERSDQLRLIMTDETAERHLIGSHPCSNRIKPSVINLAPRLVKVLSPRAIAPRPLLPPQIPKGVVLNPPPLAIMRNQNHIQRPFFHQK